jgi:hypothetical protein
MHAIFRVEELDNVVPEPLKLDCTIRVGPRLDPREAEANLDWISAKKMGGSLNLQESPNMRWFPVLVLLRHV